MTVTLSLPPFSSASSSRACAASPGRSCSWRIPGDRSIIDHVAEAIRAEQESVAVDQVEPAEVRLDLALLASQVVGQRVSPGVSADVLRGDVAGVGHRLGHGVILGQSAQLAVAIEVRTRVAEVDDEQVDARAEGRRQRRAHAEEPSIGIALLGERQVDHAEVVVDPSEELARLVLVDLEPPLGRLVDQLQRRGDRQAAGDLAGGPASHPVGHDHRVAGLAGVLGQLRRRDVGQQGLLIAAHPEDQEMVFVVASHPPRMRDRAEFGAHARRLRLPLAGVSGRRRDQALVLRRIQLEGIGHHRGLHRTIADRTYRMHSEYDRYDSRTRGQGIRMRSVGSRLGRLYESQAGR